MEDTQHMENLHTRPDSAPPQPTLSRRERREREKRAADERILEGKRLATSVKQLKANLADLLEVYAKGYNEFAQQNPGNTRKMISMNMPWKINPTLVPLTDLLENMENPNNPMLEHCMSKEVPGSVNVMYFRIDSAVMVQADAEISVRPGIPETVEDLADGKLHTQLFYHAIVPLQEDSTEFEKNQAMEKLLGDFMVHIFCMGVDLQHSHNNRQWQNKLNQQTDVMKEKAAEVEEIFKHAGEVPAMEINKETN